MSDLRPSFDERDRYLDLLSEAYADGRLDEPEFERRSNGVLAAVTHGEALAFFEGLPEPRVLPVSAPPPEPPPPAPVQAYSPSHYSPAPSGQLQRRTLIGVGGAVGVLAVLSVFGLSVRVEDAMDPYPAFPVGGGGVLSYEAYFVDGVQLALASLADSGLTHIAELHVTAGEIRGWAASAPGAELVEFAHDGSLTTTSSPSREATRTLELPRIEAMVPLAIDMSAGALFGDVTDVELVWDGAGEPLIRVTAVDGGSGMLVDVAESGEVVNWEET